MKKTIGILAASVAMAVSGSVSAAPITIDLFNTNQAQLIDNTLSDGGLFSSVAGADIIGGHREIGVELLTSSNPVTRNASVDVSTGYFSYSNAAGASSQALIRWDGTSGTGGFGAPTSFNLNEHGLNQYMQFELLTIYSDLGYKFVIGAYTDANNWSTVELTATAHNAPDPGSPSSIPLMAFLDCDNTIPGATTTCAGSAGNWHPVDWTNLGALQVILNPNGGTTSLDLILNEVTVPEPASLALAGLGLLGLGAVRRRRTA